jgi:hypothetical protein
MVDAPRATTALSLLRAVIGVVSTALYIRQNAGRSTFFGPDGVYGLEGIRDYTADIGTLSLYAVSDSGVFFEIVFHVGLVVALLVALGVGGRPVLAAHILNVPEFFLPGLTPLLVQSDWLMVIGTYATVLTSVFFPVLVSFRAGRPVAVTAMLTFHLAIAALMGLTSFALVMAAFDLLFVNAHVVSLQRRARSLWDGATACISTHLQREGHRAKSA